MKLLRLINAILICRKLKDEPLDIQKVGDRHYYIPCYDENQVKYNIARGEIRGWPVVERLIGRFL